jgi:hypothetical protein
MLAITFLGKPDTQRNKIHCGSLMKIGTLESFPAHPGEFLQMAECARGKGSDRSLAGARICQKILP